jgi:hypothetical protein
MKKVIIIFYMIIFYQALSFGSQFMIQGIINNESSINIYCTVRVKECIKKLLDPKEIIIERGENERWGVMWGNDAIPFYWNDNFIVDIPDIGILEYTECIIPNAYGLLLFAAKPPIKFDISASPDNMVISYHIKAIQFLTYFFSKLIFYDENGSILLTLEDLAEYYDGANDLVIEVEKDLERWNANDYLITITQEMIDSCRKKYNMGNE